MIPGAFREQREDERSEIARTDGRELVESKSVATVTTSKAPVETPSQEENTAHARDAMVHVRKRRRGRHCPRWNGVAHAGCDATPEQGLRSRKRDRGRGRDLAGEQNCPD